jgi:hypothetical protein
MAKIPKSGIANAQIIQASHIVNIIEALDGTGSYDIDATGSFSGSFQGTFSGDGSSITGVTGEWDGTHVGNANITGSLEVTVDVSASAFNGSGVDITGVISSSYAVSSSYSVSSSYAVSSSYSVSSSYAAVAASASRAENIATADLTLDGNHTHTLGSNTLQIGGTGIIKLNPDTLVTTASFNHSGSFTVTNSITAASFSGSFSGSFEGDGSGLTITTFPYTGSAVISGSLSVTGSINGRLVSDTIAIDNTSAINNNVSGSDIYPGMITLIDLSQSAINSVRLKVSPAAEYPIGTKFDFYVTDIAAGNNLFRLDTSETFEGSILAVTNAKTGTGLSSLRLQGTGSVGDRISITNMGAAWAVEGITQNGNDYSFV